MKGFGGIKIVHKGDFSRLERWLNKLKGMEYLNRLDEYGKIGCKALAQATPKDSGTTAKSWTYKITRNNNKVSIGWYNTNANKGVPIAIILEYGHGCRNGSYVRGQHFVDDAISPVFEAMKNTTWEEVTKK